jgi:UDP-N-acetylmuramate: L-alanyl-gamma-D-glutamyl-meso-diaminopimelate ligase
VADAMRPLGTKARVERDIETLARQIAAAAQAGDQLVLMSNGSFGGLHERLLEALRSRHGR